MIFQQMKVRPRSTRTITDFRGLWHNLEDQAQLSSQSVMRWYDERNLAADMAPAMATRGGRVEVRRIDWNIIPNKIIAAECSGGSPVILDEKGILYCHGNNVNTLGEGGIVYRASLTHDEAAGAAYLRPEKVETNDSSKLGGLLSVEDQTVHIKINYDEAEYYPDMVDWTIDSGGLETSITYTYSSETLGGIAFNKWEFPDYDIVLMAKATEDDLPDGWKITIKTWSQGSYSDDVYMVRMGANVIILPEGVMVDAAKLEAGEEVEVQAVNAVYEAPRGTDVVFNPCLLDGTIVTPVVGTTAPNDTTEIWADTTGDQTVMRQWVSALESWQAMQQTYVRVDLSGCQAAETRVNGTLQQWDAIKFKTKQSGVIYYDANSTSLEGTRTEGEIIYLLNSSQIIYKRVYKPDATPAEDYIVIEGILDEEVHAMVDKDRALKVTRKMPTMDYVVECNNRLWGCYYGPNEDGTEIINEIYASKLGDPTNWQSYQGLSTDSWTASRGRNAPFTGAAVLDNSPLFFREQSMEKVYPSSTGAHQIQTFDLDGVEIGGHKTLCVVENKLYYKATRGVMVYDGTTPQLISSAFGDMRFKGLSAVRYKRRYLLCMRDYNIDAEHPNGYLLLGVYDIPSGDWHIEDPGWEGVTVTASGDRLCFSAYVPAHELIPAYWGKFQYDAGDFAGTDATWYAETGIISYELPEHKFISCVRIRFQLSDNSTGKIKAFIQYDDSGTWIKKCEYPYSNATKIVNTQEINLYPLRCDHFRLRLEGVGACKVVSISYRLERSEGGH